MKGQKTQSYLKKKKKGWEVSKCEKNLISDGKKKLIDFFHWENKLNLEEETIIHKTHTL